MADVGNGPGRRRRSNGDESRERILDAASEIASMRGYSGTSIAAVSKVSGLPPSSIYWHFADKDDLLAAVIERSYGAWVAVVTSPLGAEDGNYAHVLAQQALRSLRAAPDFLRLGLMLVLEHRPEEPKARAMYLQVRDGARSLIRENLRSHYPDLDDRSVQLLANYALATADGLFVAGEASNLEDDLPAQFDLLATSISQLAEQLGQTSSNRKETP
ncbi:TetR/AcrR family transcriptional regulator [Skermania piniformis]|uniref:TetR/AcrR family transcriptional regulator n=1 Tax=Skermania pinensis TaxID=39122 RepID=A0ABX8SE20_9ACTN|nr:TetR/AcrR family transcriptional regulator [Skermania piniformis]